ncbi:hypothetical protein PSP6_130205 [Paraburkholderia tropica]|nr:hypothetical protein PSP6_130205 [Paraburkholderia tropica]
MVSDRAQVNRGFSSNGDPLLSTPHVLENDLVIFFLQALHLQYYFANRPQPPIFPAANAIFLHFHCT